MSIASTVNRKPPLLSFMNLQTGKSVDVQFNPADFPIGGDVDWKHFKIPGLSHEPMQYVQTKNDHIVFKLEFICHPEKGKAERDLNHDKLKFFWSLRYPKRGATNITDSGPPRILVVWPNFLSLEVVLIRNNLKFKRFNLEGVPIQWEVDMELHTIRDMRISSDEVLTQGFQRSGGSTAGGASGVSTPSGNTSGSNPPPITSPSSQALFSTR